MRRAEDLLVDRKNFCEGGGSCESGRVLQRVAKREGRGKAVSPEQGGVHLAQA